MIKVHKSHSKSMHYELSLLLNMSSSQILWRIFRRVHKINCSHVSKNVQMEVNTEKRPPRKVERHEWDERPFLYNICNQNVNLILTLSVNSLTLFILNWLEILLSFFIKLHFFMRVMHFLRIIFNLDIHKKNLDK